MRLALSIGFVLLVALLVGFFARGLKPPDSVRLATGIADGGYWQIGSLYRTELARDGIAVELVASAGSIDNIRLLTSGAVDLALVQGGIDLPQDSGLQSLGAMFLEPIAIFRSATSDLDPNPGEWQDIRLAAGPRGSGTRAAAETLIAAAQLQDARIDLLELGGSAALDAVRSGQADAVLIVSPLAAPFLMEAIFDPALTYVPLALVDALALRMTGAQSSVLPAGAVSLDPPRPPADIKILSLRASLLARDDLHPAVVDRFVNAATLIHSPRDILQAARAYPSVDSPPVPINEEARQRILSGPNFLHDFFPYWIAAQFGRVMLVILPVLFLAPPILRAIPAAYVWFQKRRIWSFYRRIATLERSMEEARTPNENRALDRELAQLDASLANLNLPLAYRQDAYDARLHIDLIRQELRRRRG